MTDTATALVANTYEVVVTDENGCQVSEQIVIDEPALLTATTDASAVSYFGDSNGSELESGEEIYLRFCGGCHGFNGIARYVNSPSFALRERMHKSDEKLARSIRKGKGAMPSWEDMLQPDQIFNLVKFIRTLADSYENGIDKEIRQPPGLFFRFRPKGETGPEWNSADPGRIMLLR